MSASPGRCFRPYPHPPHVEVRFIAGGEPGPVPTTSHVCPGVEPEPELDPAVDQVIPSEMWDACVVPAWTRGDEMALYALEAGLPIQPWQMAFLARHFPEEAS